MPRPAVRPAYWLVLLDDLERLQHGLNSEDTAKVQDVMSIIRDKYNKEVQEAKN